MRTVSAMDLRRRMGEILDAASAGERILVERDRRPLAVLISYEDALRLEEPPEVERARALEALDRLATFAQRHGLKGSRSAAEDIRHERDHGHGPYG